MALNILGRTVPTACFLVSRATNLAFKHRLQHNIHYGKTNLSSAISTAKNLSLHRVFLCTANTPIETALNSLPVEDSEIIPEEENEEDLQLNEEDLELNEDFWRSKNNGVDEEEIKNILKELGDEIFTEPAKKPVIKGIPQLTQKEKKELRSHAHSLGDKLKTHQVGKSGVSPSLEGAISDALEANELLKVKVHRTCPEELDVVATRLQEATKSVLIGKIGRTFILYRPSLRKKRAESNAALAQETQRQRSRSSGWKNKKA